MVEKCPRAGIPVQFVKASGMTAARFLAEVDKLLREGTDRGPLELARAHFDEVEHEFTPAEPVGLTGVFESALMASYDDTREPASVDHEYVWRPLA